MLKPLILDRYIIRKFIGTYVLSLLLITVVVIIFDLSEKIDDFVEKKAPITAIIFAYYMNFIPYIVNLFSALFVFITVILFTSQMASHSEIIAILSGGMSFFRMMFPYFISSLCICAISIALNLFIIPPANATRLAFEEQYVRTPFNNADRNLHYQLSPGVFIYIESFATWDNTARLFTMEEFTGKQLRSKISAESAKWDDAAKQWTLTHYSKRTIDGEREVVEHGEKMELQINFDAEDLKRRTNFTESMNYYELNSYIDQLKQRGDKGVKFALIEKNTRIAVPFSVFILTLIGVSLSSRKVRGGIGLKIGIGLALSFSYILFLRFSEMFVHANLLPPVIALWVPNCLYAVIAIILYRIAPK
ncbi:MAG: LptF/LptG family permease [Prevotellaceae bacterium]|jgi:lipopolysaccharide export system permease protein|nr:LptF/LptG family permease [Prevotellaceae bacterium]